MLVMVPWWRLATLRFGAFVFSQIDLNAVPPSLTLLDADRFDDLRVTVMQADHVRVGLDTLLTLAGDRADDPDGRRRFDGMIASARDHGRADGEGGVRADI